MLGETIASKALGEAGKRRFATEQTGPRPGGVRPDAVTTGRDEQRTLPAIADAAARATRP